MVVDRQEVKTYIRDVAGSTVAAKEGWDIRHTTDFHSDVWYYLRGEEYSAQLDYFIRCIAEGRRENISSFTSAVQTDCVVSAMSLDAGGARRRIVDAGARTPAQSRTGSGGLMSLVTGALR
jgi:hypothetical protein